MVLPSEVEKHINNLEFSQAINILRSETQNSDASNDGWLVLLDLCSKFEKENFPALERDYLSRLKDKKEYEKYAAYFIEKPSRKISSSISEKIFLIECFWQIGQIEKFRVEAQKTSRYILDNKLYNKYPLFLDTIRGKTIKVRCIKLDMIRYYLETANYSIVLDELSRIKNEVLKRNKKLRKEDRKFLDQVLRMLNLYKSRAKSIYFECLRFELLSAILGSKLSQAKLKIDFLLLSEDLNDYVYILEQTEDEKLKELLLAEMKNKVSLASIPTIFEKTRLLIQKTLRVENVEKEEAFINVDLSLDKDYVKELTAFYKIPQINTARSEYDESVIEGMNFKQYSESQLGSIVVSFISMDLFHAALIAASYLPDSANKIYLEGTLHFYLTDYHKTIEILLPVLKASLTEVEKLPFLYYLGRSEELLGHKEKAKNYYMLIMKIDNSFRDIQMRVDL